MKTDSEPPRVHCAVCAMAGKLRAPPKDTRRRGESAVLCFLPRVSARLLERARALDDGSIFPPPSAATTTTSGGRGMRVCGWGEGHVVLGVETFVRLSHDDRAGAALGLGGGGRARGEEFVVRGLVRRLLVSGEDAQSSLHAAPSRDHRRGVRRARRAAAGRRVPRGSRCDRERGRRLPCLRERERERKKRERERGDAAPEREEMACLRLLMPRQRGRRWRA